MNTLGKLGAIAAVAGSVLLASPAAFAGPDEQATVDHAMGTIQDLRRDKAFGTARDMMHTARAILIAPRIFKGAFLVGGEGGSAVLMVRGAHGWSNPAFYTIASASFGLQIGAKESELILFIRSERALHALMRDKFKIGGDAGIAVATIGSDVQGATTANAGADIIAWGSSAGVFAGLSLDGSVIAPAHGADQNYYQSYYGKTIATSAILHGSVANPGSTGLRRALDAIS